jgi:hypothetical protein
MVAGAITSAGAIPVMVEPDQTPTFPRKVLVPTLVTAVAARIEKSPRLPIGTFGTISAPAGRTPTVTMETVIAITIIPAPSRRVNLCRAWVPVVLNRREDRARSEKNLEVNMTGVLLTRGLRKQTFASSLVSQLSASGAKKRRRQQGLVRGEHGYSIGSTHSRRRGGGH